MLPYRLTAVLVAVTFTLSGCASTPQADDPAPPAEQPEAEPDAEPDDGDTDAEPDGDTDADSDDQDQMAGGNSVRLVQSLVGYEFEDRRSDLPACETEWGIWVEPRAVATVGGDDIDLEQILDHDAIIVLLMCSQFEQSVDDFDAGWLMLISRGKTIRAVIRGPSSDSEESERELLAQTAQHVESGCERESGEDRGTDVRFTCPHATAVATNTDVGVRIYYVPSRQALFELNLVNFREELGEMYRRIYRFDNRQTGLRISEGDELAQPIPDPEEADEQELPRRLSRSDVQETIDSYSDEFDACEPDDDPPDNVLVRFDVLDSGEVTDAEVRGEMEDTEVATCLEDTFEAMEFPQSRSDSRAINYRVDFD